MKSARTTSTDWHAGEELLHVRAARGGIVTAAGTWIRFVVQIVATIVLARALGPSAYGFTAVVMVVSGFAELVRVSGAAASVVRSPHMDGAVAARLHRLTVLLGLVGAVVVAAASPVIAASSSVSSPLMVAVLGLVFLPAGLGAVPAALLARNLRFRETAFAEVIAVVVGTGAGLVAALAGAGPWALVAQALAFMLVQCVVVVASCPWRPGAPAPWAAVRGHLHFGGNLFTVQSLNVLSRGADKLLVSAVFGASAAGLYAQASQLVVLPLEQVTGPVQRVAIPVLSRARADAERLRKYTRVVVGATVTVLWPAFGLLAVLAEPVVDVLFGRAWLGAVPVLQVLAIGACAQVLSYVSTWLFSVTGVVGRQTVWTLVTRPVLIGACALGLPWGPTGVAVGFAVMSAVLVVPQFVAATRGSVLRLRDVVAPVWSAAIVAVVAAVPALVVFRVTALDGWAAIGVGAGTALAGFALAAALVPEVRRMSAVARRVVASR